jgi:prolyl 4-hydroxylase
LKEYSTQNPIICYDSVKTLRTQLQSLKREKVADEITPNDFTSGTMCLNQTFSRQLQKWGLKWSYSTAFYPGESKFATILGRRIEEATQLNETHGGKFLITSYPLEVGSPNQIDCNINEKDERDKYASFMVYLNDMGADGGGTIEFPKLGIDVKPRQSRALTWNSMNYETGECDEASLYNISQNSHQVQKMYAIQRSYYYKNFYSLGKRLTEPSLPNRPQNTPKVSCNSDKTNLYYCRMFDEWTPDHLLEFRNNIQNLI